MKIENEKEVVKKYIVLVKEDPSLKTWDFFNIYDKYEEAEECIEYHLASFPIFKIEKVYLGLTYKRFMEVL